MTTWFAAGLAACATGSVPAFSVQPPVTPGSQGLPITSVGGIAARAAFSEPALATRIAWHPSFAASAAASSEDTRPAVLSLLEQRQSLLIMQGWDYSCGAASLATLLNFQHGDPVTEREIALGLMARPEYVANPIIVNIRKGFSLADLLEGFPGVEKLRLGHGPIAEQGICEQDTITVPTAKNDEMAGAVDHDRHHRRSPRYELVERHLANPTAAIAARGYWDTKYGTSEDGGVALTGNFDEFGFNLSATKRQDPLAFVGAVGYATVFANNNVEPGDTLSLTAAAVLAASPSTSLRLAFTQQFSDDVKVNDEKIDGSDSSSGVLTIGASPILGPRALVDLALDVGLSDDAPDYAVRLSVPVRFDLPRS